MDEHEYLARHLRNMRRNSRRIRAILEKSYANLGKEIARQQFVSPTTFAWSKNVKLAKRVDLILGQQNFRLKNEITRSIISEWRLASEKNDELVRNYIGDTYVYHKARKELFQANTEALNAFILRADTKQFNLSKRVWNLTNETKAQLKFHIGQGIATGKGASEISRDIRNVLVEPNRLYRRVRDKTGKLVLSKPAKLYKPGSGAYRSSYKNALRLAITETSMAYRTSDFVRRNQLPFIVGYKVNLSGSHPMTDICDDMKGIYPKEFMFVGWHPHCLCYTTAILMKKEKFIKYLKTGKLDKRMYVNKLPIKAERYVNKHASKIGKMKNKPYWTENFNKDLKLKSSIGKIRGFKELETPGGVRPLQDIKMMASVGGKVQSVAKADMVTEASMASDAINNQVLSKVSGLQERIESLSMKQRVSFTFDNTRIPQGAKSQGTMAYYQVSTKEIRIGRVAMEHTTDSLSFGKFNVGVDFKSTVRHEYGHHVFYEALKQHQKDKWVSFFQSKYTKFDAAELKRTKKLSSIYWKNNVSVYASTNEVEAFAEVFSAYTSPLYGQGGKRLPLEIEKILEKLIGKRIYL